MLLQGAHTKALFDGKVKIQSCPRTCPSVTCKPAVLNLICLARNFMSTCRCLPSAGTEVEVQNGVSWLASGLWLVVVLAEFCRFCGAG